MLPHIDGFLLENLLLTGLSPVRLETMLVPTIACVASLLIKWLVSIRSSVLLFDDEVWRSTLIGISCLVSLHHHLLLLILVLHLVGELADVFEELAASEILLSPPCYVVVRLFLLQALENHLILSRYLHKLSLAGFSIQTLFELKGRGTGHSSHLLRLCHTAGSRHLLQGAQVGIGVGDALWVLQNVGHLFEKDSILPLNLSVPL